LGLHRPSYQSISSKAIFLPTNNAGGGGGIGAGTGAGTVTAEMHPITRHGSLRFPLHPLIVDELAEGNDSKRGTPSGGGEDSPATPTTATHANGNGGCPNGKPPVAPMRGFLANPVHNMSRASFDSPLLTSMSGHTNTPPLLPQSVASLRIKSDRGTWTSRRGHASPVSSPIISHAPAALQATLPQLLLNRHRRNDSTGLVASPRFFGSSHCNGTGTNTANGSPHTVHAVLAADSPHHATQAQAQLPGTVPAVAHARDDSPSRRKLCPREEHHSFTTTHHAPQEGPCGPSQSARTFRRKRRSGSIPSCACDRLILLLLFETSLV
jgi:hypothetical protein